MTRVKRLVLGLDPGIKGRKRHILTDTQGLIMTALVHAADIQDRDGAPAALAALAKARDKFPWLRHIFADGGYPGEKLRRALMKISDWTIEIIKRSDDVAGFEVLPRRWVVERIPDLVEDRLFAWPGRSRRLAKDWERSLESAIAWLFIAYIHILTRRLARHCE